MASEQWLLNDASVANNAYFTAVGSSYKLRNVGGSTLTRRTTSPTPYEGAGYYASGLSNESIGRFYDSSSVQLTGSTKYVDSYFYLTGYPSVIVLAAVVTGDETNILYTWIQIDPAGSFSISSYDNVNGNVDWTTSATSILPTGAWFRIAYKTNSKGINEAKLFKGTNINGTTADATLTKDFSTQSPFTIFGAYEFEAFCIDNTGAGTAVLYADSIQLDTAAYPTHGTAYTANATSTGTATGTATASITKTIAGTPTATGTGTATASVTKTANASATITVSGTATLGLTRNADASASATATGTSTIDLIKSLDATSTITASGTSSMLVTISSDASASATASATAALSLTVASNASATITASGTATLMAGVITIDATSTITANAVATAQPTSPGTLYGNAEKVAGLYGSLSKPTLTTRS